MENTSYSFLRPGNFFCCLSFFWIPHCLHSSWCFCHLPGHLYVKSPQSVVNPGPCNHYSLVTDTSFVGNHSWAQGSRHDKLCSALTGFFLDFQGSMFFFSFDKCFQSSVVLGCSLMFQFREPHWSEFTFNFHFNSFKLHYWF